jgi:hydrogenase maturation protease
MTTKHAPGTSSAAPDARVAVEVLVCGSPDRGDDGAAIAAAALIGQHAADNVVIRVVGSLDIDHLLAIPADAGVVIVDCAVGIRAGRIVELPLTGLIGRDDGPRPRSSHALAFPEVIGLAEFIRGRPLCGRVVVVGGSAFGFGDPFSRPVAAALPALATAVLDAVEDVRSAVIAGATPGTPIGAARGAGRQSA